MTPSRQGFPDPQSPAAKVPESLPAPQAQAQAQASPAREQGKPDQDLVHQHVLYALRKNPEIAKRHKVLQVTESVYLVDGHEVTVEWRHATEPGKRGCLVVVDGPMKQPLIDYLLGTEANKDFDTQNIACTTSLHHVPKDKRMTFDDTHKQYTRLEAMKVAKEQASIREKAADYTRDGKQVPEDLVRKYNKVLRQKLRHAKSKEDNEERERQQEPIAVAHAQPAHSPAATPMPPMPGSPLASARGREASQGPALKRQPSRAAVEMAAQATQAAAQIVGAQAQAAPIMSQVSHSLQTPRHHQGSQFELQQEPVAVHPLTHRGISLNGIPQSARGSFQPPMTRSWSGACLTPRGDSSTLMPQAMQGQAVPVLPGMAVAVGQACTAPVALVAMSPSSMPVASPPASFRQASVSYLPHDFSEQQHLQEQQYLQEQQLHFQGVHRQFSGHGSMHVVPGQAQSSLASVAAAAVSAQPQGGIVWRPQ